MKHRARFASAIAGLLACLCIGAAGAAQAKQTGRERLAAHFQSAGLSFRYPGSWRRLDCKQILTSFTETIVFLSSASLAPACSSFGWPHERLGENGLLIMWWDFGRPGWDSINRFPGQDIRVGGESARIAVQPASRGSFAGACSKVGATRTVNVAIRFPQAADNWYQMTACVRGPDFSAQEAKIRAMLASVMLEGRAHTVEVSSSRWGAPVRLAPANAYTFAPKLAVSEDGQMIAGWYAGVRPEVCACGAEEPARTTVLRAQRTRLAHASGTKVVVDPGALPAGFQRPIVLSDDGSDGEDGLEVAVSGKHVAYAAWEEERGGWRIVSLHGRQVSKAVRLPHRAGLAAPQLDALLTSRDGPVVAVWTQFGHHDDWTWDYAALRGNGRLGRVTRIARIQHGYGEPRFAVNDSGQLAAAWVNDGKTGEPSQALLARCPGQENCSTPAVLSLGDGKPAFEEVAVALSDEGTVSVLVSGHDNGAPTAQRVGRRRRLNHETNYGLWGTSGPIASKLPEPSLIAKAGSAPLAAADGKAGAVSAFQMRDLPNLRLAVALRPAGTTSFAPPFTLPGSRAPQPAALTANLKATSLIAWQQHSGSGQSERWSTDAAIVQSPRAHATPTIVGVNVPAAQRVPGTNDAAGPTPTIGLDADGEAVVLWNRSCKAAVSCGMYTSMRRQKARRRARVDRLG